MKSLSWSVVTCCSATIVIISVCGHSAGGQKSDALGVTCDEYAQKELAPPNIGGQSQSTDLQHLITAHGMDVSIGLLNKVQSAVNEFCGRPNPYGGNPAKRNNSRPIDEAVDWSALL